MGDRIGVFVAWPYASGDRHVGHVAGAYLPPDIFARYHRLRGNDVIMVSGSDSHATPTTVRAFLLFEKAFALVRARLAVLCTSPVQLV